jgi:hypothetical protein
MQSPVPGNGSTANVTAAAGAVTKKADTGSAAGSAVRPPVDTATTAAVNDRITATPVHPANGAGDATSPEAAWCDWWPWLFAIDPQRPWSNRTPLPPVSVSTDTH